MKNLEKKIALLLVFIATSMSAQMGVGTRTPHPDAMLEVATTNKGILLPRVALTATTAVAPLSAHVAGMTVYNTATTGDVSPGYYYNDGSKWIKVATGQGLKGDTGIDGKSAYQIWKDAGNTGTESDFLLAIKGDTGAQGPAGANGAAGPQGPAGANGVDGAVGPQGPAGPAGANGVDGAVGPQGPAGPAGANGVDGAVGPQGPAGPAGANGVDGVVGPQGPAGANGVDGAVGPQGPAGANGVDGAVGPQGPAGPAGANGVDGAVGPQGPAGPAGANGVDGAVGPQGPAGPAGANGVDGVVGPQGPAGANGAAGPQGPAGANGVDGAVGPQGPAGANGAAGPAGPQGPAGANGAVGPQGPAGANGKTVLNGTTNPVTSTGTAGDFYINTTDNTIFGPKDVTTGWPATGTSLVGPAGSGATFKSVTLSKNASYTAIDASEVTPNNVTTITFIGSSPANFTISNLPSGAANVGKILNIYNAGGTNIAGSFNRSGDATAQSITINSARGFSFVWDGQGWARTTY